MPAETRPLRHAAHLAGLASLLLAGTADARGPSPARPLGHLIIERWGTAEGLPQNAATALAQTPEGYLWIGSQEGITRTGGHDYRTLDQNSTSALARSETVHAFAVTADGALAVGTRQGVVRVEPRSMRARPLYGAALGRTDVQALTLAADGALWAGTSADGLFRCARRADGRDGCRRVMPALPGRVQALTATPDGAVWVGTERGLFRLARGRATPVTGLPDPFVLALAPARGGGVWAGTRAGAARVGGVRHRPPIAVPLPDADAPTKPVWAVMEDAHGALWMGLEQGGLARAHAGRTERLGPEGGFPPSRVLALMLDREGSIWVGTEAGGLARLRDGAFDTITPADGLSSPNVLTVAEDARGRLWAGTEDGALHRIAPPGPAPRARVERRLGRAITSLAGTPDGVLWVGTLGAGLHPRAPSGAFALPLTQASGLPSDFIYALHATPGGVLWVGTDAGLARVETPGGRPRVTRVLTTADGLESDVVTAVLATRDGVLWVGTYDGGLARIGADGRTTTVRADVLGSEVVSALYEDAAGVLWVGTYGGGLSRFDGRRWGRITPRHGLPDDKVYQVLDDGAGHLWMGSNQGVARVSKRALAEVATGLRARLVADTFDEDDGMRSREVNGGVQPAGWRARDGHLYFPTTAGLATVAPGTLAAFLVEPPVVVEAVEADGGEAPGGGRLRAGTRRVVFRYAALALADPEAVRYRTRLDGYDAAWSAPTVAREASYTGLAPGTYTFRVQATRSDGAWMPDGAAAIVSVAPFAWQTTWFWVLAALLVAGTGTGGYLWRVSRLKAQSRRLEAVVAARTHDLQVALDEREVLVREVHHRVKNNLQVVSSLLRLQGHKTSDAAARALLDDARARVVAMAALHERLYRAGNLARLDGGAYLAGIAQALVDSSNTADTVRLVVDAAPVPLSAEQAVPLGLIANELLQNALKHAATDGHSTVALRFGPAESAPGTDDASARLVLTVEDDGPGLPPDALARGTLGLTLVAALAAKLDARVESGPARLDAAPGERSGARFTLTFPARPVTSAVEDMETTSPASLFLP